MQLEFKCRPSFLKAKNIYNCELTPYRPNLYAAIDAGMLAKRDLVDGGIYEGFCRHGTTARWSKQYDMFVYKRIKQGKRVIEWIVHAEDDVGYDLFVPVLFVGAIE
jgi:hypothetical protein